MKAATLIQILEICPDAEVSALNESKGSFCAISVEIAQVDDQIVFNILTEEE